MENATSAPVMEVDKAEEEGRRVVEQQRGAEGQQVIVAQRVVEQQEVQREEELPREEVQRVQLVGERPREEGQQLAEELLREVVPLAQRVVGEVPRDNPLSLTPLRKNLPVVVPPQNNPHLPLPNNLHLPLLLLSKVVLVEELVEARLQETDGSEESLEDSSVEMEDRQETRPHWGFLHLPRLLRLILAMLVPNAARGC